MPPVLATPPVPVLVPPTRDGGCRRMQQSTHLRHRLLSGPLGGLFPPTVVPPVPLVPPLPVVSPLPVVPPLPLGPSPVPRGGRLPPVGPLGGLLVPPVLPTTTPPAPPGSPPVWIGVQRPPTLVANGPQLG